MKRTVGLVVAAYIWLVLSPVVWAATLYVNNSGSPACSDATAKASNNASNPWCTVGRAAWGNASRSTPSASEAADAGDTVLVTPGTYATAGQETVGCTLSCARNEVAYNSYNSGSPGSPITYQCTTARACYLTFSSGAGPVYGACSTCGWGAVDYITWDGFVTDEATAPSVPDTGSVVVNGSTGVVIKNCDIDGNGGTVGDNHTGVRVEGSTSTTIRSCRIHNLTNTAVNPVNAAGIEVYNSKGNTFEQNEIYDVGGGIFFKAIGFVGPTVTESEWSDMEDIVRKNYVHDVLYGLVEHRHFHTASTVYILWYQNIVANTTGTANACFALWTFPLQSGQTHDGPSNARFVNNTCYNASRGLVFSGGVGLADNSNNLLQNNLISTVTYGIQSDNGSGTAASYELDRLTLTRNWYYSYTTFENWGGNKTFATFQSTYSGQEADTTVGTDPQFVSAGTNFHLQGGSPALTAGRVVHSIGGTNGDTIPVGAYITGNETIGIEPAAGSSPRFVPGLLKVAEVQP